MKKNPLSNRYPRPSSGRRFRPRLDPRKTGDTYTLIKEAAISTLTSQARLGPPRTAIITTIFPPEEMYKPWLLTHFYRSHPKVLDSLMQYMVQGGSLPTTATGLPLYSEAAIAAGFPKFVSGPVRVAIDEINCFVPMQEEFGAEENMSPESLTRASLTDTHCLMFPENINTPSPTLPGQVVEISYEDVNNTRWSGGLFGEIVQEKPIPGYESSGKKNGKAYFDQAVNIAKTGLVEDTIRGHRIKISQDISKITG